MPVLSPRFRWILPEAHHPSDELLALGRARGLTPRTLGVLAARGHGDRHAIAALFDPPAEALHDPWLLPDATRFAERIGAARARGERVLVFGDFDADGLTGLAILVRALRKLDVDVAPYVPDRLEEGHGLSDAAVAHAARGGRTLIVTVDTGTSSVEEIARAAAAGIDVLVTDHHRPPVRLPEAAAAIVNPHLPTSTYPFPRLAGSGVAFKLAQLLVGEAALDLADLATIGSLADVVPVVGENRAIVRLGLDRLRGTPRPAVAALLARAGIGPERLDLDSVGYALAPRLNAVGRMGRADAAARLLLTDDAAEADALADELEAANLARRTVTAEALAEAKEAAGALPGSDALVIAGDWPAGVIGLVAGKLADRTGRPVVVCSRRSDPWRVSARSPAGFDLAEAFAACADLLTRHGGHAAAAGAEVPASAFEPFRERLRGLSAHLPPPDRRPPLRIDLVLDANAVDYPLFRELRSLDGTGDPAPLVGIHGLRVTRTRATDGGHLQLTLRRRLDVLDGICFDGARDHGPAIADGHEVDVVARLASRVFGGFESLQLEVRDLAPVGTLRPVGLAAA